MTELGQLLLRCPVVAAAAAVFVPFDIEPPPTGQIHAGGGGGGGGDGAAMTAGDADKTVGLYKLSSVDPELE
jgi:hypothetical protein